ncbi:hypothetical protein Tco_0529161 [Tanacetum coccineum]
MNSIVASRVSAADRAYLVETKTPESPHTVASPTPLPDSTPPILVPILHRTARTVVRVPPAMSPGLSTSIAEVAAMSDSMFPEDKDDEDDKEEDDEDDEEEDEEIEESSYSDSESKDAKDEGPTVEDEDSAAEDEGLAARDEGPGMRVESLSLGGDESVLKGQ